jgi:hypothetical protein
MKISAAGKICGQFFCADFATILLLKNSLYEKLMCAAKFFSCSRIFRLIWPGVGITDQKENHLGFAHSYSCLKF